MNRFLLHFAPKSRAEAVRWLLEESGEPYDVKVFDLNTGAHKGPEHTAVNPHGKVPTLIDRGVRGDQNIVVNETAAICIYLGDALPKTRLAPPIDSPLRGPFLQWCVYRAAVMEPALTDLVFPRAQEPPRRGIGWPPFPEMIERLSDAIKGQWILGEQFTAADVAVGSMLDWTIQWGKMPPERTVLIDYVERLRARPAYKRKGG